MASPGLWEKMALVGAKLNQNRPVILSFSNTHKAEDAAPIPC